MSSSLDRVLSRLIDQSVQRLEAAGSVCQVSADHIRESREAIDRTLRLLSETGERPLLSAQRKPGRPTQRR